MPGIIISPFKAGDSGPSGFVFTNPNAEALYDRMVFVEGGDPDVESEYGVTLDEFKQALNTWFVATASIFSKIHVHHGAIGVSLDSKAIDWKNPGGSHDATVTPGQTSTQDGVALSGVGSSWRFDFFQNDFTAYKDLGYSIRIISNSMGGDDGLMGCQSSNGTFTLVYTTVPGILFNYIGSSFIDMHALSNAYWSWNKVEGAPDTIVETEVNGSVVESTVQNGDLSLGTAEFVVGVYNADGVFVGHSPVEFADFTAHRGLVHAEREILRIANNNLRAALGL